MNRLVIVGNGFDLAHGLPTSYGHFIDSFWRNLKNHFENEEISNVVYVNPLFNRIFGTEAITCFKDFEKNIQEYCSEYRYNYNGENKIARSNRGELIFSFKNDFFKIITNKSSIQNWVDIENEYYKLLKDCLKEIDNNSQVKKLNSEFEDVKRFLEEYLKKEIFERIDFTNSNGKAFQLANIFDIKNRYSNKEKYFQEFPKKYHTKLSEFNEYLNDFREGKAHDITASLKSRGVKVKNLFLTFNYTPTLTGYKSHLINTDSSYHGENQILHIHGEIGKIDNKINFGFGDEMDDYKTIEKRDDNEYLKNIKSFPYFQNSNYRQMLDFIDSEEFQVYIMGHSCGLSDRILLNKIFEHRFCASIKVFYYKNGNWDNYTDIVQNISRHFNQKEMMREKIVNKSLCQPLPQNIRFAKKNGS